MSRQLIKINASTAAIAAPNQVGFSVPAALFRGGSDAVLSVEGLAGAETVSFWIWVGATWEELADSAGTQIVFTATRAADTLNAPGTYGITKTATVGAIKVLLNDAR